MGLKQMTNGLPAFLNCTRDFLLKGYLELLPRELIVGEILEDVQPDADVLAACLRMKERGYRFALDDYEDRAHLAPFLEIADFVKIDFLTTSLPEQKRLGEKFVKLKIPLIAEKWKHTNSSSAAGRWAISSSRAISSAARRWYRATASRKTN
jgi:c-di-GMP-related signal transduction protein